MNMIVWVIWLFNVGAGEWQKTDATYSSKDECEVHARAKAGAYDAPTVCRKGKIPKPPAE
jgi:hypothetical protein